MVSITIRQSRKKSNKQKNGCDASVFLIFAEIAGGCGIRTYDIGLNMFVGRWIYPRRRCAQNLRQ